MSEVRISAEARTEFGKGAARRIRRDQKVPAVLYGHGNDPRHIALPSHALMRALKVKNALLTLEIGGKDELAIPKDIQRDPIRGSIEHVDLLLVRRGEKVSVSVALHVIGDPVPDARVQSELTGLEVLAEATHIPTGFDVTITDLPIGTQIHARDVALPSGVELVTDPEALVLIISPATMATVDDDAVDVAGAAPAAAAGSAPPGVAVARTGGSGGTRLGVGRGHPRP
ncbi:MAG: 50S ribosomal protein L25/general stress protein Ctc, partial [Sporichthyaceae bacterium]